MDSLKFAKQVRNTIKEGLQKPIPGNPHNVYSAVIEGFLDPQTGTPHQGLRRAMSASLAQWSEQLKESIVVVIQDSLDQASRRLQDRVEKEESGRWDRQRQIEELHAQQGTLEVVERRLIEIETIVKQLIEETHVP